jgi:ribokinase
VSAAAVVVVGSVNVDLVAVMPTLPGPGETVIGPGVERHGGGKGANAAVAAARLGAGVALVAAVGDDAFGAEALADLERDGVDVSAVAVLPGAPTGAALIVVDRAGENQIAVGAGANFALSAAHVERALDGLLDGCGCVVVGTEIPDACVAAAVTAAAAAGVRCVLNPAPARPALLEVTGAAPLLTPNAGEARLLAEAAGADLPEPGDRRASARAGAALAALTGAPVVVTLGAAGALLVRPGAEPVAVPPRRADVVDTTGAGDTFNGALAVRLAASADLEDAVRYAVAAAALSVTRAGARGGMPTAAEVAAAGGA